MRTKIEATWIVGHEGGQHRLIRDGVVVYEGNTILAALRNEAQHAGEAVWNTVAEWGPCGRTAEQASPWSFPLVE